MSGRDLRWILPFTLVEVTVVAFQNRYLLRPSPEVNDLFVGVLGRAQRLYDMRVCSVAAMSTHWHALLVPRDAEHLADFMEHVDCNLSKEIGTRLHGWPGAMWNDRYHHVPVADEEAAQIARLRYQLAAGVKENLVDRACDWPGVHSAKALIEGADLVGHWYDRTKEYAARQLRRERDVDAEHFATEERLVLSPLPCWEHLPEEKWRRRVKDLVQDIDEEGRKERERTGKCSMGVKKILRIRPTRRPPLVEKSPKPRIHAKTKAKIKEWREAYGEIVAAFRVASERLLSGDRDAEFPEGTFPPALPFVSFAQTPPAKARGQPS
jgi:hypothetical protein